MHDLIRVFEPQVNERSIKLVSEVLTSRQLTEGRLVKRFEEEIGYLCDARYTLAVNNCTAALHLSLILAGVGYGDEVILSPVTFIATGQAVLACGARAVFADVDPRTGNILVGDIKRHVTQKTRAIIVVHYSGYPADLKELGQLAAERNVPVIEDAAHAFGAVYKGQAIGAISKYTCFSFQSIKHVTSGDGGMLVLKGHEQLEEARRRRWFGMKRGKHNSQNVTELGFKYSMNEIAAAIGLGNLSGFSARLERREAIVAKYRSAFDGLSGIELTESKPDRKSSYLFFTVLVERRDDFQRALLGRGIEAGSWHQRIDRHPVFGSPSAKLPGVEAFDKHQIMLPCRDNLTEEEIEEIVCAVLAGW